MMRDEASRPFGLGEDRADGGCARPRADSILALLWQAGAGAGTIIFPSPRIQEGDTGIGEGANKDIHPDTKERTMGAARFGRNNLLKATLLVVAGVLAACLVAIVGAAGPVGAAFPGENGKIAFQSNRDGNGEIYTMNAGGTGPVNLTNHPAHDLEPAFSPDGTKMAFSSTRDGNYEVYTMNADGSGVERLTNTPDAIEWNSDWGPLATRYDFVGFYAPVDNLPTFNKAKAGSAIPVKFSLGGDQGLDVFAKNATGTATSPTSGPVACDSTAEIDPIETTVSAGSSGLSYDAASDTYTYVWKTHKGWTGCRQLVVEFDDGTVERANFRFVK